ncbi:hypothetical protein JCM21714_116 [Gracilibacillus boraciitolerans JCM 21714]|uniref:GTP cyclohydrolase 1 type 2 homolog n=1 Tax=Gracilibacillus boraciitolerans JCM 21714 TaxID=1298598 RepID=W4VCM4_9BACI|nr:Nif3-like dinuclear metal center hexameric protein [Gracilibacillus boraciitolerans]GAE91175.1 hypothetical protein JCM21714_116 [Gracilibacillus boraciitolerans JCM 21714]
MTTVEDVITLFEKWVPKHYAESWDNVGLQVGNKKQEVKKLLISLDVVDLVVEEAIKKDVDLIIAHHPLLFKGLKIIDTLEPKGHIVQKLLKHNIAVYAAHTNLDVVNGGINDLLSEAIEIKNTSVLIPTVEEKLYKFIVYVPSSHIKEITAAIGEAGAGHIGNYSHCSFQSIGTGAFKPLEGTNPFIGTQGEIERVEEYKLETIVKESQLSTVLQAAISAHPYEEMAYDLFPLAIKGEVQGLGRIGKLAHPMTLQEYCDLVKEKLQISSLRYVGKPDKMIENVAILGGSGKEYITAAMDAGADLYITGDLTFHEAQEAEEAGLCLIDPGHHVEEIMKEGVKKYFMDHLNALPDKIDIIASGLSTDPFRYR